MDWGGNITYIGTTSFKGKETSFGIKDHDRVEHVSIIGKSGSGRARMLANMALQDAARGMGVLVIDAAGNFSESFLERLDDEENKRIVYIDPSDAEYPYIWNPLDDFRVLPLEEALPLLVDAVSAVYGIPKGPLTEWTAKYLFATKDATLISLYELAFEPLIREKYLPQGSAERAAFDSIMNASPEVVELISQNGRYLAKDTLMRNVFGQVSSKFTLDALNHGGIVVIDVSRIRMFPTRIIPIVRSFLYAARARALHAPIPYAAYLYDCLRCFSETDIDLIFPERKIAFSVSDMSTIEEDRPVREKATSRSGTVIAFPPPALDNALTEKIFYPYVSPEDMLKFEPGEMAVALTIDSVRARPFFGKAVALPSRTNTSAQDVRVSARDHFALSRHEVDLVFRKRAASLAPKPAGKEGEPGSFSNAFRSIFAKRPDGAAGPAPAVPPASRPASTAPASPEPSQKAPLQPKTEGKVDVNKDPSEVPEETLREILYVKPISF